MRFIFFAVIFLTVHMLSFQDILPDSDHLSIIQTSEHDSLVGWAYLEMDKKYYRKRPDLCEAYIDSAKMQTAFIRHSGPQASVKFTLGKLMGMKKDDDAALRLFEEALQSFRDMENVRMEGQTLY